MKNDHRGPVILTGLLTLLIGCGNANGSAPAAGGGDATTGGSEHSGGTMSQQGGGTSTGGVSSGGNSTSGGSSALGGQGGATGGSPTGGVGGQTAPDPDLPQAGSSSCDSPVCCVPIALYANRVDVYQVGNKAIVNLVIEVLNPGSIELSWTPFVEVTTSWGGTQSCRAERRYGKGTRYVNVLCPAVVPSTPLTCETPTGVQVRLRSETYAGTTPFAAVCVGESGPSTSFAAEVKCATCPSSPSFFGYLPCDYPTAPVGSEIPRCSAFLPCTCLVNEMTGEKTWSCPQPQTQP